MTLNLQKLFHILPEEQTKVLQFCLFAALLQAGVALGMTAADSLFLTHLGAEKLPIVYLCMPVVMAFYAPVYSALHARLGIDRLVKLTLLVLAAGGVAFGLGAGLVGEKTPWFLYAAKFYGGLWFIALYTLFWNFADDYFSILDSKRLYGVIAAGASLGSIVGAALVLGLTQILPPAHLYFAWSALALLAFPAFTLVTRHQRKIDSDEAAAEEGGAPAWQILRFIFRTFGESRFALAIAVLCFAAVNLTGVLEYLAMGVLAESKTPAQLAQLLGRLHAVAACVTLVINLVFFGRIVGRIGVANTALLLPLCYLSAFAFFYLEHGGAAAIFAFYAYQTVLPAIEYNNVNLLFNALPARVKPLLRTFVEAMAEPLATAFAGVFLISLATRLGRENIALAGLAAGVIALGVALFVRFNYVGALAGNLRRDRLKFSATEHDWPALFGGDDRSRLRARADAGPRPERLLAIDLLWRARDPHAPAALRAFLAAATAAELPALRPLIAQLLDASDSAAVAATLLWLESDAAPRDPEILNAFVAAGVPPLRQVTAWRSSPHPSHLASTAVAAWQGADLAEHARAFETLGTLLAGSSDEQLWAIRAVGDLRQPRHARSLLPILRSPEARLRRETLRSLAKLATPETADLLPVVLPLLAQADADERPLILAIAARIGAPAAFGDILRAAAHFSASENRHLIAAIADLGLKVVPAIMHVLTDESAALRSRSVAARTLGQLALPQLRLAADELVDSALLRAREHLAACAPLAGVPAPDDGLRVLARFYRDAAIERLEFALELLSLAGMLPDFDLVRTSLSFANLKERANAIETIQQSCPRPLFDRILFVVERAGGEAVVTPVAPDPAVLEALLVRAAGSPVPLEAAAAFVALQRRGQLPASLLSQRFASPAGTALAPELQALLPLLSPAPASAAPLDDHPIGRAATLLGAEVFRGARMSAIHYLAQHASTRTYASGEVVYTAGATDAEDLFVVADGELEVVRNTLRERARAGSVFGERVIVGDRERRDTVRSLGARVVVLPATAVTRAIEIFPALGIGLYRFKTVSIVQ